jgi:hypothetical protein
MLLGLETPGLESSAPCVIDDKQKAPQTFQSKTPRQPSPRTAKPQMHANELLILCKRHFGNGIFSVAQAGFERNEIRKTIGS